MTDFISDSPEKQITQHEPAAEMVVFFVVPGVPIAQPRQRHRAVFSDGRIKTINYTPSKHPVNVFKATVRLAFQACYSGPLLTSPISLSASFVMPRPKAMIWKTKAMLRCPHTRKPDLDNLAKSLYDALTGVAFTDDAMICQAKLSKCYAAGGENPCVQVELRELRNMSKDM